MVFLRNIFFILKIYYSFDIWFSSFQLKNTVNELESCKHKLNACLEENAKLSR